jgi:D-glycero-D-manno-heptose 1,7-bisphosphate phosphatase
VTVRLLFLDRDGTLNRTIGGRPPNQPAEVALLSGVQKTLPRYAAQGWKAVIVSNQGGVAAGYLNEEQARAIQQAVIDLLPVPVAAAYLCPHMPGAAVKEYAQRCPNRKPSPGFLLTAMEQFGARPEDCLTVGDSITDRGAAQAAGTPFCWADTFFGRSIDRGLHTRQGRWVQVREGRAGDHRALLELGYEGEREALALVAVIKGSIVGWLALQRGVDAQDVWRLDTSLGVHPAHRREGIPALLMEAGMGWAVDRPDLCPSP